MQRSIERAGGRSKRATRKARPDKKRRPGTSQAAGDSSDVRKSRFNKIESLIAMLRRSSGATIAELCTLTGWQAHSVRGAVSGTLKKKLGLKVTSTKTDGVRTYRVAK